MKAAQLSTAKLEEVALQAEISLTSVRKCAAEMTYDSVLQSEQNTQSLLITQNNALKNHEWSQETNAVQDQISALQRDRSCSVEQQAAKAKEEIQTLKQQLSDEELALKKSNQKLEQAQQRLKEVQNHLALSESAYPSSRASLSTSTSFDTSRHISQQSSADDLDRGRTVMTTTIHHSRIEEEVMVI